ncbi:MAG: hypothetical protein ACOCVQ_02270 [Bacillota bacterium]
MDVFLYVAPVAFVFAIGAYSMVTKATKRIEKLEAEIERLRGEPKEDGQTFPGRRGGGM